MTTRDKQSDIQSPFRTTLYVKAIGKGRPRFSRKAGRAYTPEATASAEAEIRWLLRKHMAPCFEGPIQLLVEVQYRRPKSAPKSRVLPCVKPDLSNVVKLIEDAANGILFKDDAQIVSLLATKSYGDKDLVLLQVTPL